MGAAESLLSRTGGNGPAGAEDELPPDLRQRSRQCSFQPTMFSVIPLRKFFTVLNNVCRRHIPRQGELHSSRRFLRAERVRHDSCAFSRSVVARIQAKRRQELCHGPRF